MTREEIIEQVNSMLAGEFEVEQSEFTDLYDYIEQHLAA